MTVFVSIPTLIDPEIDNTLATALSNADQDVHIGVACITPPEFYEDLKSKFDSKNIRLKWIDPTENAGVGRGRKSAKSMYDGEDYFLQVDSHTNFEKSWDTIFIDLFEEAKTLSDKKTILTGFPSSYRRDGEDIAIVNAEPKYPVWVNDYFGYNIKINRWIGESFSLWPHELGSTEKFLPSLKVLANCIFGDADFVEYDGLPENIFFWEEEIVQTINLLKNDFSLVWPNQQLPVAHLYADHEDESRRRQKVGHLPTENGAQAPFIIMHNFYNFINDPDNKEACEKYERYAAYSLNGGICKPYHIPETFGFPS